jgi:hypothetical protein
VKQDWVEEIKLVQGAAAAGGTEVCRVKEATLAEGDTTTLAAEVHPVGDKGGVEEITAAAVVPVAVGAV